MNGSYRHTTASKILHEILHYRRRFSGSDQDISLENELVIPHPIAAHSDICQRQSAVHFILPAFPAKSPNPNKVLGTVPDMAEKLALTFLNALCENIKAHAPGALTICSDGHVFSDLINVNDDTINTYQGKIKALIHDEQLNCLDVLNLGDIDEFAALTDDYDALRSTLLQGYADPLEDIRTFLINDEDGTRLYRAITRFMFEDGLDARLPGLQNGTAAGRLRQRAYGVIQSSWAWGNLLAQCFPDAIRLSIHPQTGIEPENGHSHAAHQR